MKKYLIILLVLFTTSTTLTLGQGGKYGEDSVNCVMNISLFNEYYKQKNYTDAIDPWRWVFNNCPKGTKRTYLYGEKMYKKFIKDAASPEEKSALVDTLMMIFDQRITYYDDDSYTHHLTL